MVIGLGTRLVHMWHSESESKTTVLQKSAHRQSTLQIAKVGGGALFKELLLSFYSQEAHRPVTFSG